MSASETVERLMQELGIEGSESTYVSTPDFTSISYLMLGPLVSHLA